MHSQKLEALRNKAGKITCLAQRRDDIRGYISKHAK